MSMTAKDFQNPLLRVLGDLTGLKAGIAVKGEDTYAPVMALMGITDINALGPEASSGQPLVARLIQWANKNLRKTGLTDLEGRGQWILTDKGVQEIQSMTTSTPIAAPVVLAPITAPAAAPAVAPVVSTRSPFLDDPYILERVLSSTPCLGYYSTHKGAECVGCPVLVECRNVLYARMSKAALKLAAEDAKALQAGTPAVAAAPAAPTPTPTPRTRNGVLIDKDSAQKIEAFEDAICNECGKVIPKNTMMVWADDVGGGQIHVFHPKCFEALP